MCAARFLFSDAAGTDISTFSLHDALPILALDDNAGRAIKSDHRLGRVADCYGAGDLDGSVAAGVGGVVSHVISEGHAHVLQSAANGVSAQVRVTNVADAGALLSVSAGVAF